VAVAVFDGVWEGVVRGVWAEVVEADCDEEPVFVWVMVLEGVLEAVDV
jgi:hypothetical protein